MKTRVLYVFDTMTDVRFLDGFSARFELIVLSPSNTRATNAPDSTYEAVTLGGGRLVFVVKAMIWMIRFRSRYDVVFALDNLTAALAVNLSKLVTGRPSVQIEGRQTVEYFRAKKHAGLTGIRFWLGLAAVRFTVAVNRRLVSRIGAISMSVAGDADRKQVRLIPWYGADIAAFTPGQRSEARRRLDIDPGEKIALYRSRIAPEKDPETFVRAVAMLNEEGLAIRAMFVGAEYDEFSRICSRYGVEVLLKDHVHPLRELPDHYRAADVLVQTSKVEGLGISVLEALACGTPVIVTDTGGLREIVDHQRTGLLVPKGDPQAVRDALAWIFANPKESAEMAERGRQMVVDRFSSEAVFDQWASLADELARKVP